jgi:hypothetical protein
MAKVTRGVYNFALHSKWELIGSCELEISHHQQRFGIGTNATKDEALGDERLYSGVIC